MLSSCSDQRGNVEAGEHAMIKMITMITILKNDTRGASAMEYGLIAAMIVIAMIAGLTAFADAGIGLWDKVETNIVG